LRHAPNGTPVCDFSLAVSRRWTAADGSPMEKAVWFKITAWRRQAELASEYLSKGRQVMVLGEMEEPEVWQDKDGNQRASLVVTAQRIQFLGGRDADAAAQSHSSLNVPTVNLDDEQPIPF